MPVVTRSRLFSSHLLPLLVVATGLLSSCQSSRPGFAFQPAPGRVVAVENPVVAAAAADSSGAPKAVALAPKAVALAPTAPTAPLGVSVPGRVRRSLPGATVLLAVVAQAVRRPQPGYSRHLRRRVLLQRPHAMAEAGLGTTVLGVLGLIALPIAALGLILSGGALGWIIVGGLAALAVLVAYIDPFGR